MRKNGIEAPGDEETETDPHRGAGKTEIDLQREEVTSGTAWVHSAAEVSTSAVHPPNNLGISSPIQSTE